jgi:diacylglycerol kinase family enzyme
VADRPPRIIVFFNARAGSAPGEEALQRALRMAGVDAAIHVIPLHSAATDWSAQRRGCDVLVAAGGDGTVSAVASLAVRFGMTLGVLPIGTLNHFARDVGIPIQLDEAAAVLATGIVRLVDIGTINDRVFVNTASIGAYPNMVLDRNRREIAGVPRPLAAALATVRAWFELRSFAVRLSLGSDELVRRSPFLFVGNGEYELEGTGFTRRPTVSDGRLSVYVAPDTGRLGTLLLAGRALAGKLRTHPQFETWQVTSIAMEFARPRIRVAIDGEIHVLDCPLRFRLHPCALPTLVPAGQRKQP